MSERLFWICIWAIVGICVVVFTGVVVLGDYKKNQCFIKNGYEQILNPGSQITHWEKVN